jgi:hypothetical protein
MTFGKIIVMRLAKLAIKPSISLQTDGNLFLLLPEAALKSSVK